VEDEPLKFRYVVLATDAMPMPLPFDGRHHLPASDQFLDLHEIPRRIVFVGGGFISFEFAHFAARLAPMDRQITVLEVAPRPLDPCDPDMIDRGLLPLWIVQRPLSWPWSVERRRRSGQHDQTGDAQRSGGRGSVLPKRYDNLPVLGERLNLHALNRYLENRSP
jgi:hypothetical protein